MKLEHNLTQKQTHSITLSVSMKQSLGILQMSQLDLQELVNEQLNCNPLLEVDEGKHTLDPEFFPVSIHHEEGAKSTADERSYDAAPDEHSYSLRGEQITVQDNIAAFDSLPQLCKSGQNFYEMLMEQLHTMPLPSQTESLCCYIVDCLNPRGYLDCYPQEIADSLGVDCDEVMQALYMVQSLSPCGVGALTLQECLILQLAQSHDFNRYTLGIVNEGLSLLASNKTGELAAMLHCDIRTAQLAGDAIRRLNPIPSRGYDTGEQNIDIVPDAILRCEDDRLTITMNDCFVPPLTLSAEYLSLADADPGSETSRYIKDHAEQARLLMSNISRRKQTLLRLLEQIAILQYPYFAEGKPLATMSMGSIAHELELDISTISRAVQGKYIICPRGTVSLRSLFTSGYTSQGGIELSSQVIRQMIKTYIVAETPASPLSDDDISKTLLTVGAKVSRRTVAKYRDELGIPSSVQRRRQG